MNSSLILASAITSVHAQPAADIVVTAPLLERELYDTPVAMSVVSGQDIQRGQQQLKLDETLNQLPGVFVQNRENFAQGERISIRSFGARAPFGVRGITVVVDGIPYTLPDGQAQLDAIDLDTAERIEVIRGASSVLYGNAAGGVIRVTTADGTQPPDQTRVRATGGSDGFGKLSLSNSRSDGPWAHSISLSALNFDGHRDQSEVEKYLLNTKIRRDLGNQRSLTTIINLLDNPRSEDPGALTEAQVNTDRTQAGRFTEEFDTGQTVDQQVLGLQYRDGSAGHGELNLRTFYLLRNFEQQLPFPGASRIDYDRDYFGISGDYRQSVQLGNLPLTYIAGLEARRQEDDRIRRRMSFAGELQGLTADEMQTATSLSAFLQTDLLLTDRLGLSAGGRFDRIRMKIDDRFDADDDQSGKRSFSEWSGSAGLSYRYALLQQAYANISTAFETPTFSEFANPDSSGGFNPDIEPQTATNYELGLRGALTKGVDYDLALFWVDVRDELIPFEQDGRTFYRNAGSTNRKGIEASVIWLLAPAWTIDTALTLARYTFDNYTVDGNRLDDNRLPGLPEQTWSTQLTWEGLGGPFATLETRYVGDMFADDANEVKVDHYWLINLRGGTTLYSDRQTQLKAFAGIRNLTDKNHFANVRINASNDRYFEPAAGRTFHAGLEFAF
ncbi:TonB-dependent receptor family protein [Marinobacter sp. X15-166B]|uniref:TonB-dependent receptor family protein n=1 Tax=Marinobacter sp. X15-166B TaxID=1897620 RepID=UPI001D17CBAC|nr:TonB-dependent receptor [Marinobacter sp. X15-166B]